MLSVTGGTKRSRDQAFPDEAGFPRKRVKDESIIDKISSFLSEIFGTPSPRRNGPVPMDASPRTVEDSQLLSQTLDATGSPVAPLHPIQELSLQKPIPAEPEPQEIAHRSPLVTRNQHPKPSSSSAFQSKSSFDFVPPPIASERIRSTPPTPLPIENRRSQSLQRNRNSELKQALSFDIYDSSDLMGDEDSDGSHSVDHRRTLSTPRQRAPKTWNRHHQYTSASVDALDLAASHPYPTEAEMRNPVKRQQWARETELLASYQTLKQAALDYEKETIALYKEEQQRAEDRRKLQLWKKLQARDEARSRPYVVPPPLTQQEIALLHRMSQGREDVVIVDKFNIEFTREHLIRFQPRGWLSDESINMYLELLAERNRRHSHLPKCHFFNSHFYSLLSKKGAGYDFGRVASWTRKFDIFALDILIIPIHLGNHWCMAAINFSEKRVEYYDSMGGTNPECVARLYRYLDDEHQAKKGSPMDRTGWTTLAPGTAAPQQSGGWDCGVYACRYADCISLKLAFAFSQDDMILFRRSMGVEILNSALRTPPPPSDH